MAKAAKPKKRRPKKQKIIKQPKLRYDKEGRLLTPDGEVATFFNMEKLGLRSGRPDLSQNVHHYLYGTERGR